MSAADGRSLAEKGLLALSWPLIVSFTLRAGFSWVDRIFAASLGDVNAAQAAIGLAVPFEFLMIACWVGASNALTSKLSVAMAAGRAEEVAQLKRASVRLIIGLNALFAALAAAIWIFEPYQAAGEDIARDFRLYATAMLGGSAFTAFWSILPDSIVKAHQDTKTTMWAGLASSLLNVVLNTLFVFVFHWGILGIGLSTALGRLGGLAYAQLKASVHEAERRGSGLETVPGRLSAPLRALLAIAIPSGLTYVLMALEGLAINAVLERAPDPEPTLAAWSIFDSALRFLAMPVIAVGVAMLMLSGRLRGQGRLGELRGELALALRLLTLYSVLFVAPLVLLAGPAVAEGLLETERAQEFGRIGLWFAAPAVLAVGLVFLTRGIFDAFDSAGRGFMLSALRSLGLVVPCTLLGGLLAPRLGFEAMTGYYAGWVLGSAAGSVVFWVGLRPLLRDGRIADGVQAVG